LFMLQSLDILVLELDQMVMAGKDKKATVLEILSGLFDTVVAPALPSWAKPFVSAIKNYAINVLLSNMIDAIVEKYHNAVWPEVVPAPVVPTPVKMKSAKPKTSRKKKCD